MPLQKNVAAHLKKSAAASLKKSVAPQKVSPPKKVVAPKRVAPTKRALSTKADTLLKDIEELRLKPYDDQTGKEITSWVHGATIGYGLLIAQGDWGKYQNGITAAQAETLFKSTLAPYVAVVNNTLTVGVSQQQFDALVIFAYNIGESGFANSSVAAMINNPQVKTPYSSLEKAWKAWNKSQGKVNRGLINRRSSEWDIYTKGVYKKW